MELRLYWEIIRRRIALVIGLVLVALLSYLVLAHPTPPSYNASMRFVVGVRPEQPSGNYYTYDRYYTWLTAEYLLDDLAEVVKSSAFAQDVTSFAGVNVPAGAIQGATATGKLHRILTITITWRNREELVRIAEAVVRVLRERGDLYFAQLATNSAVVSLIDPPSLAQGGASLRQRLDLSLRLILALIAGVALTFLLDYLDNTIRHRADLETFGLPILAEIPAPRGWLARLWRGRSKP
jgi:capsular polysaccharide biosynthesis protein